MQKRFQEVAKFIEQFLKERALNTRRYTAAIYCDNIEKLLLPVVEEIFKQNGYIYDRYAHNGAGEVRVMEDGKEKVKWFKMPQNVDAGNEQYLYLWSIAGMHFKEEEQEFAVGVLGSLDGARGAKVLETGKNKGSVTGQILKSIEFFRQAHAALPHLKKYAEMILEEQKEQKAPDYETSGLSPFKIHAEREKVLKLYRAFNAKPLYPLQKTSPMRKPKKER